MIQPWSNGYVADVAYIEGFYVQQSPMRLALACHIGGVAVDLPEPDDQACYLELGCGMGIGALLTAAANPGWQVIAVDYNPAHIAVGASLARTARLENIRFVEADLTQFAESAEARSMPAADFVSMHGLWSWVGGDVRAGIVRLLAAKTRPGAIVHVSYNALPAWQGAIGMQRIIYEAGIRAPGRSDLQAQAGLALARDIKAAGGKYLVESPLASDLIDTTGTMATEYLSHEFMSAHWKPAFHADVAAAMAEAKLDWVASANPLENFNELMLTEEQRALLDRYKDPIVRELIKDTCQPRQLRHDVFVRGARRLRDDERDAAIARLTLMPTIGESELQTKLQVPAGTADMSGPLKTMMVAAMRGPATIADLLALEPGRSSPTELIGVLVGSNQCQVAMRPDGLQPDSADRLNRVLASRVESIAEARPYSGLASSRLGGGLSAPPLLQFIAGRMLCGEREDRAEAWIERLASDILPEKHDKVREVVNTAIEQRVPVLRQLRIVPE
ncbi:class I SAM-dependent methyltransferase [Reyranella sp.]|uniref:class I SAM-dependent methyltransferase n=1 Tax=Reyranella sp. TaxID=1929291 RepID=UPI0011F43A65|nr:class I SAM-dependent methyltransferase [Reyranella sp.]TAJ83503.1 MAG: methyltransferase domain-containing protein [Reyranella sp.]